jgi:hypothetical protein
MCIDRPAYIKLGGRLRRYIEPFPFLCTYGHVNNVGIMNQRARKFRGPKGKEIKRLKIEGHDENSNIWKT